MGWLRCCGSDRVGVHCGRGVEGMFIAMSVSSLFLGLLGRNIGTSSNSTSESESLSCSSLIEAGDILRFFLSFDIGLFLQDISCRIYHGSSLCHRRLENVV